MNLNNVNFIYWLGFFWADGHIRPHGRKHMISMEIQKHDADFLEPIFNLAINTTKSIRIRKGRLPAVCFRASDKELGEFLKSNDYLEKSYKEPTKILNLIPKNLQFYWWRGYFDGDGCLAFGRNSNYKSLSISGQHQYQWKSASSLFNELKIKFKIRRSKAKTGSNSKIESFRQADIESFFFYLYPNQIFDFGLKRKYDKFIELKIRPKNQ